MDNRKSFEIDFESLELTNGEENSIVANYCSKNNFVLSCANQTERKLSKEEILEGIKKLSSEDQNEVIVSASKSVLTDRITKMRYCDGVIADAKDQSNALLLSSKLLQEGLNASANTVG